MSTFSVRVTLRSYPCSQKRRKSGGTNSKRVSATQRIEQAALSSKYVCPYQASAPSVDTNGENRLRHVTPKSPFSSTQQSRLKHPTAATKPLLTKRVCILQCCHFLNTPVLRRALRNGHTCLMYTSRKKKGIESDAVHLVETM